MTRSRSALAEFLDRLAGGGTVSVTERPDSLSVYQLSGAEAVKVAQLLADDGWDGASFSDEGGAIDLATVAADEEGVTVQVKKPGVPAGVEALLTRDGLTEALKRPDLTGRVWVHGLNEPFETLSVRLAPWGDDEPFEPAQSPKSLRGIVRVLGDRISFPDDLGRWLLRVPDANVAGIGIAPWRQLCIEQLAKVLAQEIEPDGRLTFTGPPLLHFAPEARASVEQADLQSIEEAVSWMTASPPEIERRHTLLAAEIARSAMKGGNASDIAALSRDGLRGARIAYNYVLADQSKDALKALGDLRKGVSDETSKLGETARSLATAVASAAVANITLIIARLTIPEHATWVPLAALAVAVASVLYVGTTILIGAQFLWSQRNLRTQWRSHLYRFLSDAEYKSMVADPIKDAESTYFISSASGGAIALLLLIAVCLLGL